MYTNTIRLLCSFSSKTDTTTYFLTQPLVQSVELEKHRIYHLLVSTVRTRITWISDPNHKNVSLNTFFLNNNVFVSGCLGGLGRLL